MKKPTQGNLRRNKQLSGAQENTTRKLMEMTQMVQNLQMEFSKDIETLGRTQVEMKMKLKMPIS